MTGEAEERVYRYRTLNDAAFGLALGLGAFSLTAFPIHGLEDIVIALVLFAITFMIILGIWHDVHRMLKYPFGMSFAFLDYLLVFLVVIIPFSLRLMVEVGEVREVAVALYPLNILASQVVLGMMYQSFVMHNRDVLSRELVLWAKESRNFVAIVAFFYGVSLFLPSDFELLPIPGVPQIFQRFFLWFFGYLIAIVYGIIYEKVHGVKFAAK